MSLTSVRRSHHARLSLALIATLINGSLFLEATMIRNLIVLGLMVVSLGILAIAVTHMPRYQMVRVAEALVIRLDTRTGQMRAFSLTPSPVPDWERSFHITELATSQ